MRAILLSVGFDVKFFDRDQTHHLGGESLISRVERSISDKFLHAHHFVRAHQELLKDSVRNRAFDVALRVYIIDLTEIKKSGAKLPAFAPV